MAETVCGMCREGNGRNGAQHLTSYLGSPLSAFSGAGNVTTPAAA